MPTYDRERVLHEISELSEQLMGIVIDTQVTVGNLGWEDEGASDEHIEQLSKDIRACASVMLTFSDMVDAGYIYEMFAEEEEE